jgi:hypothetical protein
MKLNRRKFIRGVVSASALAATPLGLKALASKPEIEDIWGYKRVPNAHSGDLSAFSDLIQVHVKWLTNFLGLTQTVDMEFAYRHAYQILKLFAQTKNIVVSDVRTSAFTDGTTGLAFEAVWKGDLYYVYCLQGPHTDQVHVSFLPMTLEIDWRTYDLTAKEYIETTACRNRYVFRTDYSGHLQGEEA